MYQTVPMYGPTTGVRMIARGRPGGLSGETIVARRPRRGWPGPQRVPVSLKTPSGYITDMPPAPEVPVEFVGLDLRPAPAAVVQANVPKPPPPFKVVALPGGGFHIVEINQGPRIDLENLPPLFRSMNGFGDFMTTEESEGGDILSYYADAGVPLEAVPVAMATSQEGLAGPFDAILNALGLRDPIAHYEPEMQTNLPRIYGKYADLVSRYYQELPGLRSNSARAHLFDVLSKMARLVEDLRPVFEGGVGVVGERERDKLADLVQGVRDFQTEYRNAKNAYGWGPVAQEATLAAQPAPVAVPAPLPAPAFIPAATGFPWGVVVLGAAAVAVGSILMKKGRRRTA